MAEQYTLPNRAVSNRININPAAEMPRMVINFITDGTNWRKVILWITPVERTSRKSRKTNVGKRINRIASISRSVFNWDCFIPIS